MRRRHFAAALCAAPFVAHRSVHAAGYPERPIQILVGFPPGQASDIGARVVAARLGEELKQTVIVDNKAGAMGIISHQFVKGAAPDGYTLLYGSSGTLAINRGLYRKLPYDPLKDFQPVILLNSSPMFLVSANDTPVRNLKQMIAFAKANPGKVSYGSSGNGATQHIAMEMLKKEAGIDMLHVPYKGSPPMVTDLIAGRVQFAFDVSTSILPHARAGRVRLIGVSSAERLAAHPDIPTVAEQGLPGFEALTWAALMVPAGTPAPIVHQLNAAANRALRSKEVREHYAKSESQARGGSPDEFAAFLRLEVKKWGEAVVASGAQVD
ncbi:tripartite tricarboxylate transporter substrate binding protein [Variovorax sp. KK3]|uniref:Bug family tripartite tricarboxylate transporter substrate binding protein n=1 Tax=Variovorax sp. KK3 TaxID=1855728 RepID=UPI00097C5FE7|nr:tripartite tricarboxylate transporter substrate binding protein [Variovorax sp. KK3]